MRLALMIFDKKESQARWSTFWGKKHILNPFYVLMDVVRYFSIYTHMLVGRRLYKGGILLEAGCGSAKASLLLLRKGDGMLVGVDFSVSAVQRALEISKRTRVNANFIVADIASLPLRPRAVSFSWNMGVIEHFINPIEAINEMVRVTEKDGAICVIVPTHNNILIRIRNAIHMVTGFYFDFVKYWGGGNAINAVTNDSLYHIFLKAGLTNVRMTPMLSELLVEEVVSGKTSSQQDLASFR
jgi:ubiquinone/menaquinone biosynthesis C-methylase UbiE